MSSFFLKDFFKSLYVLKHLIYINNVLNVKLKLLLQKSSFFFGIFILFNSSMKKSGKWEQFIIMRVCFCDTKIN